MPQYNLNALGSQEFERLVQALLKVMIGAGTITFGAGPDGGREATFEGSAPYPSKTARWTGVWIFQAKFHDMEVLGTSKARTQVIADVESELEKITLKYKRPCNNYVLFTNVPLSAVSETGTLDVINEQIIPDNKRYISNVAVLGYDDINRLLEVHRSVRNAYLHFIVAGDLIAQLMDVRQERMNEIGITIKSYLATTFMREQDAQLDQAGHVSDDSIRLQKIFFDLHTIPDPKYRNRMSSKTLIAEYIHQPESIQTVRFLLSESAADVVIVGGPGEGKSTLGQYLAQLHRAVLLDKAKEVALTDEYVPQLPRIPFRIILRDFGQWLAERRDAEGPLAGTLEEYISTQIRRHTGRHIAINDLHRVFTDNPTLIILDGLDEVTDQALRQALMARISEFTGRCHDLLHANIQVLATTRPNSYSEQFDPRSFLHLRLTKLAPEQVRGYVARWTKARDLDPDKKDKLIKTVDECIEDQQISLLTATPLQVTILILIISVGGLPPDQHEALFDEYLEVIYKRETAKGRQIIESDKELLIGIHKFIGYILHQEVTIAESMGAVLSAVQYTNAVTDFLKLQDPYSTAERLQRQVHAITQEAGERLVLIVEPYAGMFGFELRAIQEFFAACHLTDTARDSMQRYERFGAIATLPHWRAVALFFAGRVGRNYPGETSNIIEVCREIDRGASDRFVRRGASLALELAADRAFGPNRRRQEALLEVGLQLLDGPFGSQRVGRVIDLLSKLSLLDRSELALPILRHKLESLDATRLGPIVQVVASIDRRDPSISAAISRLSSDQRFAKTALALMLTIPASDAEADVDLVALTDQIGPDQLSSILVDMSPFEVDSALSRLEAVGANETILLDSLSALLMRGPYVWIHDNDNFPQYEQALLRPWPPSPVGSIIRCLMLLAYLTIGNRMGRIHGEGPLSVNAECDDANIVAGAGGIFDDDIIVSSPLLEAVLWLVHLMTGKVSEQSAFRFLDFVVRHSADRTVNRVLTAHSLDSYAAINLARAVVVATRVSNDPQVIELLCMYAGATGNILWRDVHADVQRLLKAMPTEARSRAKVFGLSGVTVGSWRAQIVACLPGPFPDLLADYALVDVRRQAPGARGDTELFEQVLAQVSTDRIITFPRSSILNSMLIDSQVYIERFRSLRIKVLEWVIDEPMLWDFGSHLSMALLACFALGEIPKELAIRAYRAIGLANLEGRGFFPSTALASNVLSDALLVACGVSDSLERRGARSIIRDVAFSLSLAGREGADRRVPRFAGFAAMHRILAASSDAEGKLTAIALFAVRPPSAAVDWRLLGELIQFAGDREDTFCLDVLVRGTIDSDNVSEALIRVVQERLTAQMTAEAGEVLTGWLESLLMSQSQSLHDAETRLGLPLQD